MVESVEGSGLGLRDEGRGWTAQRALVSGGTMEVIAATKTGSQRGCGNGRRAVDWDHSQLSASSTASHGQWYRTVSRSALDGEGENARRAANQSSIAPAWRIERSEGPTRDGGIR